ncbi:MAG: undecaprenyldiphospho-muramoylpentapeptide beta-N-acetylglucosaminyltransferase [Proteobacteria bacterium]|nr:undecaprenyldiphospho-muramoylpentapeptide beta-N-acetylglucosaminyltransferase [Pseudomonadota bacterium]
MTIRNAQDSWQQWQGRRVLIAAGGTGGHIFPALAVAQALAQFGAELHWVGSNRGLEARVVRDNHKISLTELRFQGVRGRGLSALLSLPFRLLAAMLQCLRLVREFRPSLVLVFGGYVCFPVGIAAWLQRIAFVVHEQNAVMGTANRWLARLATRVLTSFAPTRLSPASAVCVGNPVRPELLMQARALGQPRGEGQPLRLLVIGGSLGARALNEALPEAVAASQSSWPQGIFVRHQTGMSEQAEVQARYQALGLDAGQVQVQAFIDDMAQAYAWADLVVARAGASTVSELAALGLPAVFVPLPNAIDDHQTANAQAMVQANAALLLKQSPELALTLGQCLSQLNPSRLKAMADNAQGLAQGPSSLENYLKVLASLGSPDKAAL